MTDQGVMAETALAALREELDDIDGRLLEALADRLACCRRIAEYKRAHHISMMQPDRVTLVLERAAAYADGHGMEPLFVRDLYQRLIAEACRMEDQIIGQEVSGPSQGAGSTEHH